MRTADVPTLPKEIAGALLDPVLPVPKQGTLG
jgi:hypothetical protein